MTAELPTLRRFAGYELLGRVAVGGMAEVFVAREHGGAGSTRHVALKVVRPQLAADHEFTELFLREGKVALGLRHPSVCHVYKFGVEEGHPFLAMELVQGVTLRELIGRARRARTPITAPIAAKIASSIAEALHSAHVAEDERGRAIGIVHQDVSPHNVMVAYDGTVKLLDFGVATTRSERDLDAAEKSHTTIRGKMGYLSPEQCHGVAVDARSDVFSLGVVLYEMLTASRLFQRSSRLDAIRAIVSDPLPEWPITIPEPLRRVLDSALARDRERRFASAEAMQDELERYLAEARTHVTSSKISAEVARLLGDDFGAPPTIDASPEVVAWLGDPEAAIASANTAPSYAAPSGHASSYSTSAPHVGTPQPEARTMRRSMLVLAVGALAALALAAAIVLATSAGDTVAVAPASEPIIAAPPHVEAQVPAAPIVEAPVTAIAEVDAPAPEVSAARPRPRARTVTRSAAPAAAPIAGRASATQTEDDDFVEDPGF